MATDQMKMGSDGEFFTGNLFPPEMEFPTAFSDEKKNSGYFFTWNGIFGGNSTFSEYDLT